MQTVQRLNLKPKPALKPYRQSDVIVLMLLAIGLFMSAELFAETVNPRVERALKQFNADNLSIEASEIFAGGPPKDGIPALTDPKVEETSKAKYAKNNRIVVVTVEGQTRGYPINILNWHEAVNDKIGETPFTVIYCPLCDSVSIVDRRVGDKTLEFGISGLLHNSNVLLYDRQNQSLWSQIGLEAISGPMVGKSLKHLPWKITRFDEYQKDYPKSTILSLDTGHRRDYTRNPYSQYFANNRLMFPVKRQDRRLGNKEAIVGVRLGDKVRAYPVSAIRKAENQVLTDTLNGQEIVMKADDKGGISIEKIPADGIAVHTFWFTWASFYPDTEVYGIKE